MKFVILLLISTLLVSHSLLSMYRVTQVPVALRQADGTLALAMTLSRTYNHPQLDNAFLAAVDDRNIARAEELLLQGANINARRQENGLSALHIAICWGHTDMIRTLLQYHEINLNVQNNLGETPLHYALNFYYANYNRTKMPEIINLILDRGADCSIENNVGQSILHDAVSVKDLNIMRIFLSKDHVNFNIEDRYGNTPLHYAAAASTPEILAELLASEKVNVNYRNRRGETVLHLLAQSGQFPNQLHMLNRRVNLSARNHQGQTPLDLAQESLHNRRITQNEYNNFFTNLREAFIEQEADWLRPKRQSPKFPRIAITCGIIGLLALVLYKTATDNLKPTVTK